MMPQPNRPLVPIVLGALCLFLAAGFAYRFHTAAAEKSRNVGAICHYSNAWATASAKLREQTLVNVALERDFANQADEIRTYSNTIAQVEAELTKVNTAARVAAVTAAADQTRRDGRINELESQRDDMTKSINELRGSISSLETQITETEHKLATSSSDREYLQSELKRLRSEKSELERRFYDLALLRDQVRKLRDELSVSRRLEWIRRGLYGDTKGGEQLRKSLASAAPTPSSYSLDVEVRRNESAKILPAGSP